MTWEGEGTRLERRSREGLLGRRHVGREPLETLEAEDWGRMHGKCRGPAVGMGLVIEKQTGVCHMSRAVGGGGRGEQGWGCDDLEARAGVRLHCASSGTPLRRVRCSCPVQPDRGSNVQLVPFGLFEAIS